MNIEYTNVTNLEQIAIDALSSVAVDGTSFNYIMAYQFSSELLCGDGLRDCTEQAELWRLDEVPKSLHINHGSRVKGGVAHVMEELKSKPTSNRALLSFLSQGEVNGSGDDPIPSFMIFQVSILNGVLYCTVYFRALEVSSFLRINIEEIRLRLKDIYSDRRDFEIVRLVVHAYRAYNKPNASTLRKAELDLLSGAKIMHLVSTSPTDFYKLLIEKASDATVFSSVSLESLLESVELDVSAALNVHKPRLVAHLKESIRLTNELNSLRRRQSHHPDIDKASAALREKIMELAEVFSKCH